MLTAADSHAGKTGRTKIVDKLKKNYLRNHSKVFLATAREHPRLEVEEMKYKILAYLPKTILKTKKKDQCSLTSEI